MIRLFITTLIIGAAVALTYHVFENAVQWSIDYVWHGVFNTDGERWLVVPLAITLSILFFGVQHRLDPHSEKVTEHGLGDMPTPTLVNYLKVLIIGFFSLLAGAALGPEAILVPACTLLGSVIGIKIAGRSGTSAQLFAAAGLMALFTAFFDSFVVGVLSLWLVLTRSRSELTPMLLLVAVLASGASKLTLNIIEGESYFRFPASGWQLNVQTLLLCVGLAAAGYLVAQCMSWLMRALHRLTRQLRLYNWAVRGMLAGGILSILYVIGGPLVEFTGNESIAPMFERSPMLGLFGLVWILVVKVAAICWSKVAGYRGGMIFPTIFLAAVMVAVVRLRVTEFSHMYGLAAVIIGAMAANRRNHVLV